MPLFRAYSKAGRDLVAGDPRIRRSRWGVFMLANFIVEFACQISSLFLRPFFSACFPASKLAP
jgi:hypothetical protein